MSHVSRGTAALALLASLGLAACGGEGPSNSTITNDSAIADNPYSATGAPGADMTDKGVTDGANGIADGDANTAEPVGNAANTQ